MNEYIVVFAKVQGLVKSERDPKGPHTLRLFLSADLCKNYYSHSNFTAVTFLTKIQNPLVKNTTQLSKKFGW